MGFPWLSCPPITTGTHCFPPVGVISHANFDGLLGILHTQKILVGSHAPFRDLAYEVAEPLKRGSRFMRRDACAEQRQSQCRAPYRSAGEGTVYFSEWSE